MSEPIAGGAVQRMTILAKAPRRAREVSCDSHSKAGAPMPVVSFETLPDDARVWVFGSEDAQRRGNEDVPGRRGCAPRKLEGAWCAIDSVAHVA